MTVKQVSEFNPQTDDYYMYVEANNVLDDSKKRAILLISGETVSYKLFKGLTAPARPGEKSFEELKRLMIQHQNPRPNLVAEQCKFNSRFRNVNESVSTYLAQLCKLIEHCGYREVLNGMLRDWLVCGINDERTQQRLLSEGSSLTLEKALDISLSLESAIVQASVTQNSTAENHGSEVRVFIKSRQEEKK